MSPPIVVCALSRLETQMMETRTSTLVSLLNREMMIPTPDTIASDDHLRLVMNDVEEERAGSIAPDRDHIRRLVAFVEQWDRETPLLIHCLAGMSRSTAAALITACHLNPNVDEDRIAGALRSASTTASPNRRLIALADDFLGRDGRLTSAVTAIGRGVAVQEGEPFALASRF